MRPTPARLLAGVLLALPAAQSYAGPTSPGKEAPGANFRLDEAAGWGGQTLVAPRPLYLTRKVSAKLAAVLPKDAQVLYGKLEGTAVAQARLKSGQLRVFLDRDGNGTLSEAEGITLQKGVVRWPACRDDLSAVARLGDRTAVVWSCRAPSVIFWAWRGYLRGEVTLSGTARAAFLVDGNANGKFGEAGGDLIWIDHNGDGVLDPVSEQYPWAPVLRIGGELYRFTFEPAGSGGTARYSRVERSIGRRRVTFPAQLAPRIAGVEGTLLSQADEILRAQQVSQMLELPTGQYALTSLTLQVSPDGKPAGAWIYSFFRAPSGKEATAYPLKVEGEDEGSLPLFQRLSFGMDAPENSRPGGEFPVQLWARTELGLELTNTRRTGQDEHAFPEDFATIQLLDSEGKVIEEKRTGFA